MRRAYTDVAMESRQYTDCPGCGERIELEHYYGERVACSCGLVGELECRGNGFCKVAWERKPDVQTNGRE